MAFPALDIKDLPSFCVLREIFMTADSCLSPYPIFYRETLIYWLRGRNPALRGAQKLAYLHDMSRFLCSVRLVFRSARRIKQRFHRAIITILQMDTASTVYINNLTSNVVCLGQQKISCAGNIIRRTHTFK